MLVRRLVTSRQVPEAAPAMTLRRSKRTAEYVPECAPQMPVPESAPQMPGRLMRMFAVRDYVTISVHVLLQAIQSWGEEFIVTDPDSNQLIFLSPNKRSRGRY